MMSDAYDHTHSFALHFLKTTRMDSTEWVTRKLLGPVTGGMLVAGAGFVHPRR
jgi:hypothetical protein